jgi:hypothetical protein
MDCFSPTKKLHYMLVSIILAFAKPFELVVLLLNLFFLYTVGIIFFSMSHSIDANTHTYMSIHTYKYIYTLYL